MADSAPATETLKALVYPGTTTPANVPPTLTDVLNSVGRALMSSGLLYTALKGAQDYAPFIPNPVISSLVLAVVHLLLAVHAQWANGPHASK